MKLKKLHLFIIIIGALLLGSLGFTVKEGLETMRERYNGKFDGELDEALDGEIGEGDNDYILKSAIVPPVCPKCPQRTSCPRQKPCPSCPRWSQQCHRIWIRSCRMKLVVVSSSIHHQLARKLSICNYV